MKPKYQNVVKMGITILTFIIGVLVAIPGEQGESILSLAVEALRALLGG